jgi:acyl carrier protein
MTREELMTSLERVLTHDMKVRCRVELRDATRLNEELCLDSVMLLELLLHLEIKLGVRVPDAAPSREQLTTVGGLVDFVLGLRGAPALGGEIAP